MNEVISLFDRFRLHIPPKLKCHTDGVPGHRVLFITDHDETYTVSFEEGMPMRDMLASGRTNVPTVSHQCCRVDKYIHQWRNDSSTERCAFFHIEVENNEGTTVYLPGQIVVSEGYSWSDGVEPVLLELLDGITLCK
jgi:hypothetical protein